MQSKKMPTDDEPMVSPASGVSREAAPLRRQVIEMLRNDFAARLYTPGERLSEKALCERYDVSRTVVREALRQLEADGLVTVMPNRGPVVAVLTRSDAENLCEVRLMLEPNAARLCAERASAEEKERLLAAFGQIVAADAGGNFRDMLLAGDRFYSLLSQASGNNELASLLRVIYARLQMLRGAVLQSTRHHEQPLRELRAVVQSINKGDAAKAAAACTRHVLNVTADVLRTFEERGE